MAVKLARLFYRDTAVSLLKKGEKYVMSLTYADRPERLCDLLGKWPEAEEISRFFPDETRAETALALDDMERALRVLRAMAAKSRDVRKFSVRIQPDADRLRFPETPPSDFEIAYRYEGGALVQQLPENVRALEDGWYRRGDDLWKYWKLNDRALERLRIGRVEAGEMLSFLREELPAYREAGLNIKSEIDFKDLSALELRFEDVEDSSVNVRVIWAVPEESVDERFDMPGYVLAGPTIRPGITPRALYKMLPADAGVARLTGMQIPAFRDGRYEQLKPWFAGDLKEFENLHAWVEPPYAWVLTADAVAARGVGRAYAYPTACVGSEYFSVNELRELMSAPYARLKKGWARRADLLTLGMDAQRCFADGSMLKPYRLNTEQLLFRGDEKLTGPWQRMEAKGAPWRVSVVKQRAAREHLTYLRYWGLNGGLTGGYEAAVAYGFDMLAAFFEEAPDARVLAVGLQTDILEFTACARDVKCASVAQYDASSKRTLYTCAYEQAAKAYAAQTTRWDALVLIEPDATDEVTLGVLDTLTRFKAECRIGFFLYNPENCLSSIRTRQTELIDDRQGGILARYLIRDPRWPKALPKPFPFHAEAVTPASERGFEEAGAKPLAAKVAGSLPAKPPVAYEPIEPAPCPEGKALDSAGEPADDRSENETAEAASASPIRPDETARAVPETEAGPAVQTAPANIRTAAESAPEPQTDPAQQPVPDPVVIPVSDPVVIPASVPESAAEPTPARAAEPAKSAGTDSIWAAMGGTAPKRKP